MEPKTTTTNRDLPTQTQVDAQDRSIKQTENANVNEVFVDENIDSRSEPVYKMAGELEPVSENTFNEAPGNEIQIDSGTDKVNQGESREIQKQSKNPSDSDTLNHNTEP